MRKDYNEYLDQDGNSGALRIKYKGNGFDVLWATSALDQSIDKQNDADGWVYSTFQKSNNFLIDEQMLSQEIRVSSSNNGPFEWLAGVYGFVEDTQFEFQYNYASASMNKILMHPVTDIDAQGYAFFGQGTYTLFDKLHLTTGLRYDHQSLEGDLKDNVRNFAFSEEKNFNEVLPKFSASYDTSENIMVYGSVSKGYLVGGFNWLTTTQTGFNYDPEYTWNYETGLKTTWLNKKLLVNLTIGYEGSCFDIYLWAKNIFDEEYCTWVMARNDGIMGLDGEPQTFGITATYRF